MTQVKGMRESDITPELIELSKKAKELGFPQDVEEGDWLKMDNVDEPYLYDRSCYFEEGWPYCDGEMLCEDYEWHLILSFSRCLAWLRKEGYSVGLNTYQTGVATIILFSKDSTHKAIPANGYHEAIAKAVVKVLGGE